jgi:3-hydroxy acid dehydrogenase/malonic semialdehyde reductase
MTSMANHTHLSGARVLVTGGTTGIGLSTVELLAGAGARVLTFGRHEAGLRDAIATAGGAPGTVTGITADVSRREDVERVFAAVDSDLGGVDILVACAALGADPIDEMEDDDWRNVVETNLLGYMACARGSLLRMEKQGGGHLLFVGSISTEIKAVGESVYAATKAGIQAFAETLRKEVAEKNIKVSVIQPGSVATPMQECTDDEQQQAVDNHEMLYAREVAETMIFTLTRSERSDIVNLRIEPRIQKTA